MSRGLLLRGRPRAHGPPQFPLRKAPRVSAPPTDLIVTTPTPERVAGTRVRRSRVHRMLRLAGADLFRSPRGAVPTIERGAFRKIFLLWAVARSVSL